MLEVVATRGSMARAAQELGLSHRLYRRQLPTWSVILV
jgi:hypothetical protein